MIQTILLQREQFHTARLSEDISSSGPQYQNTLRSATQYFINTGSSGAEPDERRPPDGTISRRNRFQNTNRLGKYSAFPIAAGRQGKAGWPVRPEGLAVRVRLSAGRTHRRRFCITTNARPHEYNPSLGSALSVRYNN